MLEIFDLLFPTVCTGCRSYGVLLCSECLDKIKAPKQICIACNTPSTKGKTCLKCLTSNPLLPDYLWCVSNYNQDLISKIVTTLKYIGVKDLGNTCAKLSVDFLNKNFPPKALEQLRQNFYISYIPMHKNKQISRGFNQTQLIAERLAKLLYMPVLPMLEKTKKTKAQMSLKRHQRLTNLDGAFKGFSCAGKNVLLIDDVITTGSTMLECTKELKKAGAKKVICLAFAKD